MAQLPSITNVTSDNIEIDNTFKLLEEGEEKLALSEQYKDVTLVLGNTGAGKSTFIQWMAGDNTKLISKEVKKGTGQFIIEDGNRIGSSINSKTLFPELVVDSKTNAAYYDCPGFSDTRSSSYDIAATYFIKKLADHTKNVKLILVISYPAVMKGVDRQDFMKLMRHATDLIKDISKFKTSIAIAITKVNNQFVEIAGNLTLVPDEKIIETVASFLQDVKNELKEKLKLTDISSKEKIFINNAIKLVTVLRTKSNNNFTRIGIFRRPNKPGPLSNITLLQQGKKHVEKILHEELKFTKKTHADFGYTISERSKNDINILVERINDKVWFEVSQIVEKVQNYYKNLTEEIHGTINSFTNNTAIVRVKNTEAQLFSTKLITGHHVISRLITEGENLTRLEDLTHLGVNNFVDNINKMSVQGKYFDFLQVVSNRKLHSRPWSSLFQKIETYLSSLKREIEKDVNHAAQKIDSEINYQIKNMAKEIENHYLKTIESLEIEKLLDELNKGVLFISNLIQKTNNLSSAQELSTKISDSLINSSLATSSIIGSGTSSVLHHGKYLEFLKYLNNGVLDTWSSAWVIPFNDTVRNLVESETWYKFLSDLHAGFSKYSIQKDTTKYNVENLNDWGNQYKLQGIKITKNNFKNFLEKIKQHSLAEYRDIIKDIDDRKVKRYFEDNFLSKAKQEYDIIRNIEVSESRLRILNDVLRSTLDHKIDTLCPESNKLIIRGDYIKFSDFISTDGKIVALCENQVALSSVDIFALNTIFVDRDVKEIGSRLQINIIAPRWQIIGTRTINLDGAPGVAHESSKAEAGSKPSDRGIHGLPGFPGGAAGNFLGIGKEIIYNKHSDLIITTNGGKGGPGQHGGDGAVGRPGRDADKTNLDVFKFIKLGLDRVYSNPDYDIWPHIIYGKSGHIGGTGGNGGVGGLGGINGTINIIKLYDSFNTQSITVRGIQGNLGIDGKGGNPGHRGADGRTFFANWCYKEFTKFHQMYFHDWCGDQYEINCPIPINERTEPTGSKGNDGSNDLGKKQPEEAKAFQSISYIIINYKNYMRGNLGDKFKKNSLIQFINQLDSNVDIKNSYDTVGLLNELQDIEKQFHSLHQSVDFLPFYQSLLNRTTEYAQHPKSYENSKQYKRVLSYLYTATLSKIYSLKIGSEPDLIIDLENYLKLVKQNINSLTNLKEKSDKVKVINQYKEAYKANIDKKIGEAENFIKTQVTPEIDNINTQVAHKIDLLIDETLALQKKAGKEKQQLMQKKREFEDAMNASWIFSVLQIFGGVVGCFGSLGSVMGSIIGSTSQFAESSLSLNGRGSYTTIQLPVGVLSNIKSIKSKIMALKDQKFTDFKNKLEYISSELNKHSEKLGDTSAKVKNLIRSCQIAKSSSDVNKIKELEQELKEELSKKASELKKQKFDKKVASATAVITKFNKVIQFGTVGFNIYNKHRNDKQRLETIDEAIEQANDKIQQLKQYENKIYEVITPMLKNVGNDLNNVASQLDNKSQVMLDVTQWQVQSFLKDIKLQMRQFTNGFAVEDNLVRCIEKLEETMTTLINIYDRIQNYQEQQQLAVYIADISSPTPNHMDITNKTLSNAVNELELIIRSNLVLAQYKTAVNALTQQVFPFAHRYLAESRLPSSLQWEKGLVSEAVKQVESIQSKMSEYKTAITHPDIYISSGWFNRDYVSVQPFFIWDNNKYEHVILKLLSGDKVVVKANILNSFSEKDAIKFNRIGINFYSENSAITSAISDKLKGFKVSATHLGNSYYRYNNNIYIITSESQNIQFSFEKDANGEPVHRNGVYDKIKSGDLMLSPYAMWEIQLINTTNKIHYRDLTIYKDKVNLELVGHGSYVTKGTNISNINIDNYYKAVETISGSALGDNNQQKLPISNVAKAPKTLPAPAKKSAHRQQHNRTRRQLPDIPSSASRPTSWITTLWRGVWGILADTTPRLTEAAHSQMAPDYTTGHLQGGLQLLDLIIRKWTGQKYSSPAFTQNLDISDKHRIAASELAYAAYCPVISKLEHNLTTGEVHEPQAPWLAYPPPTTATHNITQQLAGVVRGPELNFPTIV